MPKTGILLSILVWAVAIAGFVVIANAKLSRGERKLYGGGVIGVAFVTQIGIGAYYDRQRRQAIAAALTQRGFVPNTADGSPAQVLHYSAQPGQHTFKAVMSALGTIGERPAHFAEYRYSTGGGKSTQTFKMAEFAVDVNPGVPPLTLLRRRGFFKKDPNLSSDHEDINDAWQLHQGDAALTSETLSQPAYTQVLAVPANDDEQWCVRDGWVSLTIRRAMKVEDMDAAFGRVIAFARLYAPEL